ncbi:MAG: right-handed parallel beta-helix repeat-containing protein, partial [Candidatus Thorarchaeota archaeon]
MMMRTWRPISIALIVFLSTIVTSLDFYSSESPLEDGSSHSQDGPKPLGPGCPTDDTYITNNTTLDGGTCYVNDTNEDGVLIVETPDIVLDCNHTTFIGDGTGVAIMVRDERAVIKNCEIQWYRMGIYTGFSGGHQILRNTVLYSNHSGIFSEGGFNVVSFNNVSHSYGEPSRYGSGIRVDGVDTVVSNNELYSNVRGILVDRVGSRDDQNTIISNLLVSNSIGIDVGGGGTDVLNNTVVSNADFGIR